MDRRTLGRNSATLTVTLLVEGRVRPRSTLRLSV